LQGRKRKKSRLSSCLPGLRSPFLHKRPPHTPPLPSFPSCFARFFPLSASCRCNNIDRSQIPRAQPGCTYILQLDPSHHSPFIILLFANLGIPSAFPSSSSSSPYTHRHSFYPLPWHLRHHRLPAQCPIALASQHPLTTSTTSSHTHRRLYHRHNALQYSSQVVVLAQSGHPHSRDARRSCRCRCRFRLQGRRPFRFRLISPLYLVSIISRPLRVSRVASEQTTEEGAQRQRLRQCRCH
jgi:hypothetical protein